MNIILIAWLHNVYLQPMKFRQGLFSRYMVELQEAGLIKPKDSTNGLVITGKGKRVLIENLHLLDEDYAGFRKDDDKGNQQTLSSVIALPVVVYQ